MISVSAFARCISVCATMSASDFLCAHTHTHTDLSVDRSVRYQCCEPGLTFQLTWRNTVFLLSCNSVLVFEKALSPSAISPCIISLHGHLFSCQGSPGV